MVLRLNQRYLYSLALTALLAGCSSAGSTLPPNSTANAAGGFVLPDLRGFVLYEGSYNFAPGVGQVLVYPSGLKAHNPQPLRSINTDTVRPNGLWVDKNGNLWVVNIPQGAPTTGIFVYHPGKSVPYRHITDQLVDPSEVAVAADGTAYVNQSACPNISGDCVTVFPPGSNHASRTIDMHFSGYATTAGEAAFDLKGNLLVAESNLKHGLHIFKVNTRTFAVKDLGLHLGVDGPGLAVDGAGNMYVTGIGSGRIEVFAPGLLYPSRVITGGGYDIAALTDGTLYVNNYGGITEYAPGAQSPTNQFYSQGNYGIGVAVGPAQ